MPFEIADVHELLDALDEAGVSVVILGGWGVDALIGEQTRQHADIDLWVVAEHDGALRDALGRVGYAEMDGGRSQNYVLADGLGRQVDVHLVRHTADGGAVYDTESGDAFVMPSEAFTSGVIGDRPVRCVSAEQQMIDHSDGYQPTSSDDADMQLLEERFGIEHLPPFGTK